MPSCRLSMQRPTSSSTRLARSAGGCRSPRLSPAACRSSPRRGWAPATTCWRLEPTAGSPRPATPPSSRAASARPWRSTAGWWRLPVARCSRAGTTRRAGATSSTPRSRSWEAPRDEFPGLGAGAADRPRRHPQRGAEPRALPGERPRLRRPDLRRRLRERRPHPRDRPPLRRRGPRAALRRHPDHPLDLPMGARPPADPPRLGADPRGGPGAAAGAAGGDRRAARPARDRRGRLLHPPPADLPRPVDPLRRLRRQAPAEALPALPRQARPGRAGHPGLRLRKGRPPAGTARGVEQEGRRDPLLPAEAPALRRGVCPRGALAAHGPGEMDSTRAPLRHAGRTRALAEGPLSPAAALPAPLPVFLLSLLLPARFPRRQAGTGLPLLAGILVPPGRGHPPGGIGAARRCHGRQRRAGCSGRPGSRDGVTGILGLSAFHADASAAALAGGRLVAGVEEERFRRVKHWAGFPEQALAFCLAEIGGELGEGTSVGVAP